MATATPLKMAKAKPAKATPPVATTGALVDELWAKREAKRAIESQVKTIEEQISALEEQLMARMDAEGIDKVTGKHASVGITSSVVATVVDWDALCAYVKKSGHWQLFQRRVSDASYRELIENGKKVSGLTPFNKKRLNLRTLA